MMLSFFGVAFIYGVAFLGSICAWDIFWFVLFSCENKLTNQPTNPNTEFKMFFGRTIKITI